VSEAQAKFMCEEVGSVD
jgi:hypothetical protein